MPSKMLESVQPDITDRKASEEMIYREEKFTETAINSLPGIFYVYNSDWRMVRWNHNHEFLTGFSASELKGRMLLDWFYEDFKDPVAMAVRKVFEEGEAMVEAPLLIKGGDQVPYLFKGVRLEVAGEAYLMGMGIDISERKAKEEVILREKQFSETAINSLPGIFYVYNSDWRMVRWNHNHELLTGFSAEELKGRMLLDWFSEDFKDPVAMAVRKVFEEGEAMVEAPLLLSDGSEVPYLFKGVRLEVAGEAYLMGMGIDISQRKAKEEALLESETQLRLITDSLPTMIAYLDSNQRYIFVNEHYAKWAGRPKKEIIGRHTREILGEDTYALIHEHIANVLSGQSVTFEISIPFQTSESRHLMAIYVPYFKEHMIKGFFALIHDMTEFEKVKKEVSVAHEALYHVGRIKMLEVLSTSLSHEMQQPLTGVLSNAQAIEMLLNDPKPDMDEIQIMIKSIIADAKRAGEVTRQLRSFLRKQETNLQILNFNCLIEEVLRILNSDMVINTVRVVRNLADDLPQIMGDSVQLKQVLINLILNAQQAMEDSMNEPYGLVIHTSVSTDNKIYVSIEDFGPGIEEIKLEHIFEPFYTTRSGGTGMGLSICRFIIESHGGRIWAENQAEGGARICFSLPIMGERT